MLCNNCCLQSTLCLWSWSVLTFGYVLLYNNSHTLDAMYYYYWTSYTIIIGHPYFTFKRNVQCVTLHCSRTCICIHICSQHYTHIHSHVITYLITHSLQCWWFADSCSLLTGWQWMAAGGEEPGQQQTIGVVDTWWLWCLFGKHGEGTHQEHIH